MIKPWEKLRSEPAGDFRIFTIRSELRRSPRTEKAHGFYVIDCANWVNVVAVTADEHMVMIEHSGTVRTRSNWRFRGMMDPGIGLPLRRACVSYVKRPGMRAGRRG
jgi:hypothetical protein